MIQLNDSGVLFNQEEHRYFLNGKELKGITGLIHKQIFPDMYKNIPQFVLNKAAERGTLVHESIDLYDAGFAPQELSPELLDYVNIKKGHKLNTIANEYIVTDRENFASGIDLVFEQDGKIILADIKTTSVLNREYVRWQLSIYAYLFELQNPNLQVSKIYALWLRGELSEFAELERIDTEVVKKLLRCEAEGKQFSNPIVASNTKAPLAIKQAEQAVYNLVTQIKELDKQKKQLSEGLLALMKNSGTTSYKGKLISLSYKAAGEREDIDKEKLKNKYPDAYKDCLKKTKVKESLTIRS